MTGPEIASILKQSQRYWYAGTQDLDLGVRLMHLSYSKGLLDMLIALAGRGSINLVMRGMRESFPKAERYDEFYSQVASDQDAALRDFITRVRRDI